MKNPATNATKDDFNVFTEHLRAMIALGEKPLVVLRNGQIVPIDWFTKDGPEYEHFSYKNAERNVSMCWENDGHSITSSQFDMMELYKA